MAVIPLGFAQANFIYNGPGVPTGAEWTLGLNLEGGGQTPTEVAEDLFTFYEAANFDSSTTADVDLQAILVKFGPNSTGASALVSAVAGGASTAGAPSNVAYLVHKVTPIGGRAGRGRLFFPGVPDAQVGSDGTIDPTWRGNFQSAWDSFHTAIAGSSFSPVVLHSEGSPVSTPSVITEFGVDVKVATQRRRLRR